MQLLENYSVRTDVQLVKLTLSGNPSGYDELMRRYQTRLMIFLQKFTEQNSLETEDLVQETFLRAYCHLDKFDYITYSSNKAFETWLFTIGTRMGLSQLRNQKNSAACWSKADNSSELSVLNIIPDRRESHTEEIIRAEVSQQLWRKIKSLVTPLQWTVLWLKYIENNSIEEIARAMQKSPQSVKALLHRAKEILYNHKKSLGID